MTVAARHGQAFVRGVNLIANAVIAREGYVRVGDDHDDDGDMFWYGESAKLQRVNTAAGLIHRRADTAVWYAIIVRVNARYAEADTADLVARGRVHMDSELCFGRSG